MKPTRFMVALLAMALVATACGGASETDTTAAEVPSGTQSAEPDSSAPSGDPPAVDDEPSDDTTVDDESSDDELPAEPDDSAPSAEPPAESVIPAVDVVDLATGDTVNLASFAPSDRPILLWFWAPH